MPRANCETEFGNPKTEIVTVEEPLEIRANGRRYSATMRTPQGEENDRLLALGLLLSEGVISPTWTMWKASRSARVAAN